MGELREDLKKLFNESIDNFLCLPEKCPQGEAGACEDCAANYLSSRLSLDEEKLEKVLWENSTVHCIESKLDPNVRVFVLSTIVKAIAGAGADVIRIKDK